MKVLILSPHFDDAPLSLGQSLIDGELSAHDVSVGVLFGRTNWTRWFHPTPRRARLVTTIRETEERWNAFRFGYSLRVARLDEAILRLGTIDPAAYLDPAFVAERSEDLVDVESVVRGWAAGFDVVLAPLGVGDHVDHQLVTAAARRLQAAPGGVSGAVGYYEDRPYASLLEDAELDKVAASLDPGLAPRQVSGAITKAKLGRLFYPSQFDRLFVDAMEDDAGRRRRERVWFDPRVVPLFASAGDP